MEEVGNEFFKVSIKFIFVYATTYSIIDTPSCVLKLSLHLSLFPPLPAVCSAACRGQLQPQCLPHQAIPAGLTVQAFSSGLFLYIPL